MRGLFLSTAVLCGLVIATGAGAAIAPKDIASLESAGTIRDISSGAYERTIWNGNKRSDLTKAIEELPSESGLRSLYDMKRRALLSASDALKIKNDVDITPENNLFILRLHKLQEMGLYEDALKLYTDNIDTPRDARLAETGLTLLIHQSGLATACLEEKVLAPQFNGDAFFEMLDAVCSYELGQTDTPPDIAQSQIINAVLADEAAKFPATDIAGLSKMTPLELSILKSEKRYDYSTFDTTPGALKAYPSRVLAGFLADKTLPEQRLIPLQIEMARRGHLPVRRLPAAKDAKQLGVDVNIARKTDSKAADTLLWASVRPLLDANQDVVTLTPYGGLIKDADPSALSGAALRNAFAVILASGQEIPANWCDRLASHGGGNAAMIRQVLGFVGSCVSIADKAVDNTKSALSAAPIETNGKLWVLLGLFAPQAPEYEHFHENYEKHFPLTPSNDYVMHNDARKRESVGNNGFQGFGLPLLQVLNAATRETGENMNPSVLQITVKGLLDEGLEADARQLAKEVLVGILRTN